MARTALKLVKPPPQPEKETGRWQGDDDLFFHKRQIVVGTKLLCMGRIDHGTVYTVTGIRTLPGGKTRTVPSDHVQRLADEVTLQSRDGLVRRSCFASLSYSALWRIA